MHIHLIGNTRTSIEQQALNTRGHDHMVGGHRTTASESTDPKHTHFFNGQQTSDAKQTTKIEGNAKEMNITFQSGNTTMTQRMRRGELPFNDEFYDILNQMNGTFCFVDSKERSDFVFPAEHVLVNDDKGHFPIMDASHARNALARCAQFSEAPKWWDGTLSQLVNAVKRAVKQKFPGIEVSK